MDTTPPTKPPSRPDGQPPVLADPPANSGGISTPAPGGAEAAGAATGTDQARAGRASAAASAATTAAAASSAPPPPPRPAPAPIIHVKPPAYHQPKLWKQLDELAQELEVNTKKPKISVGSVAGLSTTLLSVGYVIWCLRGGSLVATLLTTLPLWKWLDPLPVLDNYDRERRKGDQNDADEERLRSMMD